MEYWKAGLPHPSPLPSFQPKVSTHFSGNVKHAQPTPPVLGTTMGISKVLGVIAYLRMGIAPMGVSLAMVHQCVNLHQKAVEVSIVRTLMSLAPESRPVVRLTCVARRFAAALVLRPIQHRVVEIVRLLLHLVVMTHRTAPARVVQG